MYKAVRVASLLPRSRNTTAIVFISCVKRKQDFTKFTCTRNFSSIVHILRTKSSYQELNISTGNREQQQSVRRDRNAKK
jgi:hypothetical protein